MLTTEHPARRGTPVPFTSGDYDARMSRAVVDATHAGLAGLLITPGPDLVWLTGYQPTAITERLTVLVLRADHDPVMLVPTLELPDAGSATGAGALDLTGWLDATDPYQAASALLPAQG